MISTFIIELTLALYVLLRREKTNTSVQIGVLILIFLAMFQLAEYGICEDFGISSTAWVRFGFASITMLPPLGLHLVYTIAGKRLAPLVIASYAAALAWILTFVATGVMGSAACGGNYVIFRMTEPFDIGFYTYYDALLLLAVFQAIRFSFRAASKQARVALWLLVAGYATFMLPSLIIFAFYGVKGPGNAVPSVMCGFAVLFALILSLKILPLADSPGSKVKS